MRTSVLLSCLIAATGFAAPEKPAAVQLCLELPEGLSLFSPGPAPHYRALGNGVFMLDLDLWVDGQAPERLTKSAGNCVRAWLPARPVKELKLGLERIPLNLEADARVVDLKLKPDLWFDAGSLAVRQQPFASARTALQGTLTFERRGPDGAVLENSKALPRGEYIVTYTPPPAPTHPCETKVEVVAMGTVTRERHPQVVAELTVAYTENLLPAVLAEQKVTCTDAEELAVEVLLVDGVFFRPLKPKLVKHVIPARQIHYELIIDGAPIDLTEPAVLKIAPGQMIEVVQHAPRVAVR